MINWKKKWWFMLKLSLQKLKKEEFCIESYAKGIVSTGFCPAPSQQAFSVLLRTSVIIFFAVFFKHFNLV